MKRHTAFFPIEKIAQPLAAAPEKRFFIVMIINSKNSVELMSPAGSFDALQSAIDNGADSIYFGVEQLNMRARSSINFTIDDLEEIAIRCDQKNVKSYLTLNTIIYDHDLTVVKTILKAAKKARISAIIAMDQAVISYARQIGLEVHISTQLNVTNIETVKFYSLFADVMVLSRELSLNQLKKIVDQIKKEEVRGPGGDLIKIEIFGHGALCMAVSGKCYLSLHSHNSSANRGACKQNCRKKYTVIDQESGFEIELDNEYMMSPKDLCTIDILNLVVDSGISVLKIEGRGRSPEYVAEVTKCYREAIDSISNETYNSEKISNWMNRLSAVYNRGFWSGYYLGQKLGEWSMANGSKATQKKIYLGKGRGYYSNIQVGEFEMDAFNLSIGDTILVTGPTTGAKKSIVKQLKSEQIDMEKVKKGDIFTTPLSFKIRPSDKLYKVVSSK